MEWCVFGCFLLTSVWQDIRSQTVDLRTYLFYGALAAITGICKFCIIGEIHVLIEHGAAVCLGLAMIGLCKATGGGIGLGDGGFFLVTGLLLGFWENVMLLCYGTLLCGTYCLVLFVRGKVRGKSDVGKQTVPFLPFVALPGVWLIFQEIGRL